MSALDPNFSLMLQRDAKERQLLMNEMVMRLPNIPHSQLLLRHQLSTVLSEASPFSRADPRTVSQPTCLNSAIGNVLVTALVLEQERKLQVRRAVAKSWKQPNLTSANLESKSSPKVSGSLGVSSSASGEESAMKEVEQEDESLPLLKKPKKKDNKWLSNLDQLKVYKKTHGDCIVPRGYAMNPRLASWVAEQRKQYKLLKDGKQSSITPERVAMLDKLDFAWNAQEAAWDRHMKDLKRFRESNGHCHVPLNHTEYPKLGLWVKEQRRHHTLMKQGKPCHMTEERIAGLTSIGFCWDTHEATWLERLRELANVRERHGSCIVPTSFPENPKLGTWVHHQRRQYKKFMDGKPCHITKERIHALDQLGFVWHPRERSQLQDDGFSGSAKPLKREPSDLDLRPQKRQRTASG